MLARLALASALVALFAGCSEVAHLPLSAGIGSGWPVGVALDRQGALLVADDVGDTVWRVTADGGVRASAD